MEARTVIWTASAKVQLEGVYKYIAEASILEADKVFDKIVTSTDVLPEQLKDIRQISTRPTTNIITEHTRFFAIAYPIELLKNIFT